MRCLRFDLWKNVPRYVDDELDASAVTRLENHLLGCNDCRARVARLRDGQRLASRLPRLTPAGDGWAAIESALDSQPAKTAPAYADAPSEFVPRTTWRQVLTSPYFAITVFAIGLMTLSAAMLWDNRKPLDGGEVINITDPFDSTNFRPVLISEIGKNTAPHIVAEGYVKEVKIDEHDGDTMFKLVEDVRQAEPFIICEIITPINLKAPAVGSRVRVYGVSRYDAKEGRQWHEVHPVLNIETVNH